MESLTSIDFGYSTQETVFNSQKLITRAVKSVLNGYSLPTEILILDDGSSDDTFEQYKPHYNQTEIRKLMLQDGVLTVATTDLEQRFNNIITSFSG